MPQGVIHTAIQMPEEIGFSRGQVGADAHMIDARFLEIDRRLLIVIIDGMREFGVGHVKAPVHHRHEIGGRDGIIGRSGEDASLQGRLLTINLTAAVDDFQLHPLGVGRAEEEHILIKRPPRGRIPLILIGLARLRNKSIAIGHGVVDARDGDVDHVGIDEAGSLSVAVSIDDVQGQRRARSPHGDGAQLHPLVARAIADMIGQHINARDVHIHRAGQADGVGEIAIHVIGGGNARQRVESLPHRDDLVGGAVDARRRHILGGGGRAAGAIRGGRGRIMRALGRNRHRQAERGHQQKRGQP